MGAYLNRVLALAADPDADADFEGDGYELPDEDLDSAADYLADSSRWFGRVSRGDNPGDPGDDDFPGAVPGISLTARTAEASTVPQPTRPPGGPGLFHIKGRELPPYVQHLYKHLVGKYGPHKAYGVAIGIVKKWAAGINPGGKGKGHKVHSDVQAAAAKNVAQWEKDKADAHARGHDKVKASGGLDAVLELAAPAAWPSGKPYKQSFLPAPSGLLQGDPKKPGVIVKSAPGARPVLSGGPGLRQAPVATVAASPPLPPGVTLPTPEEIRSVIPQIKDGPDDQHHDEALRTRLETAAHKLETGDNIGTLNILRIAQTDAAALYRDTVNANKPNEAGVFAWQATSNPPAAQSSVRTAMLAGRGQADTYKVLATTIAQWIDRFRRSYFHGQYGNLAEGRFSADLGSVLALTAKPTPEIVHLRESGSTTKRCATCSMWTGKAPDFEKGRCSLLDMLTGASQVCDDYELRKEKIPGPSAARAMAAGNPHGASGAVYK